VEHAAGGHTLAGDVRVPLGSDACDLKTLAPADLPVKAGGTHCWLLDRGKQLALKVGLNSIGRLPDNDVVVDDATVSRRHCAIVVHSDLSIEIHDVASKNGTTVNGNKIQGPTRLRDGDQIGLSERNLTFMMSSGQPTGAVQHSRSQFSSSDDRTLAG
jgi:predicted component of type VI protein secretion system